MTKKIFRDLHYNHFVKIDIWYLRVSLNNKSGLISGHRLI